MDASILKTAAEVLNISLNEALTNYEEIADEKLHYFWNPIRGGVSLIINDEGEKLAASSSISFEQHLQAFKNGRRN